MKTKFQNFNLGDVEVLSQEQQHKVKGGYVPASGGGGGGGVWGQGSSSLCYKCACGGDFNWTNNYSQVYISPNYWNIAAPTGYTTDTDAMARELCKATMPRTANCVNGTITADRGC